MNWTKCITKTGWIFLLSAAFLDPQKVVADWNAEEVLEKNCSAIEDPKFIKLKESVLKQLKGSWCSQEKTNLLMDLILIEQPKVCVEIGVFTGSSLLPMATTLSFLKSGTVYAVDAWSNRIAVQYWSDTDPNKAWWSSLDMNSVFNIFQSMLKQWNLNPYCKIIKQPSSVAVASLPPIDFLHLDGDYSETGSMKDVELYLPKVKAGGYILLSNLFTMVNGEQPKMSSFCALFDACEMVCEIERDNAVLFRKNP